MKKVVIDIGNTLTKAGLFDGKELLSVQRFTDQELKNTDVFVDWQVQRGIVSSVRDYPKAIRSFLSGLPDLIELSHITPLPFHLNYKTPQSLGKDRMAVIAGASRDFPNQNILAIDAGTAITYDIITADNHYLGGGISPGIDTRFRALHNYTGRLPLLRERSFHQLIGQTTEESIQSGVLQGVLTEIDGIIKQYSESFDNLKVVLTGGDLNYLADKLKSNIFALPNLVLVGLNEIFDFNESKRNPDIKI